MARNPTNPRSPDGHFFWGDHLGWEFDGSRFWNWSYESLGPQVAKIATLPIGDLWRSSGRSMDDALGEVFVVGLCHFAGGFAFSFSRRAFSSPRYLVRYLRTSLS